MKEKRLYQSTHSSQTIAFFPFSLTCLSFPFFILLSPTLLHSLISPFSFLRFSLFPLFSLPNTFILSNPLLFLGSLPLHSPPYSPILFSSSPPSLRPLFLLLLLPLSFLPLTPLPLPFSSPPIPTHSLFSLLPLLPLYLRPSLLSPALPLTKWASPILPSVITPSNTIFKKIDIEFIVPRPRPRSECPDCGWRLISNSNT